MEDGRGFSFKPNSEVGNYTRLAASLSRAGLLGMFGSFQCERRSWSAEFIPQERGFAKRFAEFQLACSDTSDGVGFPRLGPMRNRWLRADASAA